MVHRLIGGAASGLAIPALASAYPTSAHPNAPGKSEAVERNAGAAGWTPLFLDPHQSRTLSLLAERIIPGSGKARVTEFIDLLLSVDTRQNQEKFIGSLSAMDAASLERFGAPFSDLTEARQNELLVIASTSSSEKPPESEVTPPVVSAFQAQPPARLLHEHFENLKGWISKAYYSSEPGMKELGWNGTYFFPSFPGCEHAAS
ncbi:MAG: gluconate 2-dehydrogenase subunit 3 family protein [Terriglobia bacterium]